MVHAPISTELSTSFYHAFTTKVGIEEVFRKVNQFGIL